MTADPSHPSHPAHPAHPEHPDSHHFRSHHPHARHVRGIIGVFIAFVVVVLIAVGLMTDAPAGHVVGGLFPSVLFGLIALSLSSTDYFDLRYLLLGLIGILVVCGFLFAQIFPGMTLDSVLGINFILGVLLLLILSQSAQERKPSVVVELDPSQYELPEIIGTIEDRCKALNFVIGRVYSVHHGATKGMRERLRIDNDWYNELSELLEDTDTNENLIRGVLERMKQRLLLLEKPESAIFSASELGKLKGLERDAKGKTSVRDVLAENDKDPVDQYIDSALQFCEQGLTKLS